MRKLTHQEIVSRQQEFSAQGTLPFSVILNNVRSLYNVGSIFRTADGAGVEKIWICGITGYPPNSMISKTALGAENRVPWEYHTDVLEAVRQAKNKGYEIVLLEQMAESLPYHLFVPRGPVCLVVGNEITGVSEELAALADTAIEIDMAGLKNSLNVAVAFGVAAYHVRRCLVAGNAGKTG